MLWSCSMHPRVLARTSGKCPICAMDLVVLRSASTGPAAASGKLLPAPHPAKKLASSATFRQLLDVVYLAYLRVQVALAGDRLAEARKGGQALVSMLRGVSSRTELKAVRVAWKPISRKLLRLGKQLSTARRITEARRLFSSASTQLIRAVQAFGLSGSFSVYRFHCPMAFNRQGADWLQRTSRVSNPYYGASMLRCGTRRAIR